MYFNCIELHLSNATSVFGSLIFSKFLEDKSKSLTRLCSRPMYCLTQWGWDSSSLIQDTYLTMPFPNLEYLLLATMPLVGLASCGSILLHGTLPNPLRGTITTILSTLSRPFSSYPLTSKSKQK